MDRWREIYIWIGHTWGNEYIKSCTIIGTLQIGLIRSSRTIDPLHTFPHRLAP